MTVCWYIPLSFSIKSFLTTKNTVVVPYSPNLPDLAPFDFLFLRMQAQLQMHHLLGVPKIQEQSLNIVYVTPKSQFQQPC
jgi:hypothetical protein